MLLLTIVDVRNEFRLTIVKAYAMDKKKTHKNLGDNQPKTSHTKVSEQSESKKKYYSGFTLRGILFILITLSILSIVFYVDYSTEIKSKEQLQQIIAIGHIKNEVVTAHLWLEELLSGDREENIESVYNHFNNAQNYIKILHDGGEYNNLNIVAVQESEVRKNITSVKLKIDSLYKLAKSRYLETNNAKAGTDYDKVYDAVFEQFRQKTNIVENSLIRLQQKNQQILVTAQIILSVILTILGILIILFFLFTERFKNKQQKEILNIIDKLRESENRWKFALDENRNGVWDWNTVTNKVFFSEGWKKMLGYEEDEISDSIDEWDSRVHPDDKEKCYTDLNKHLNGETEFYENEHRVLCKDGSYLWILDRGKVISFTDDKKPLRVIGTHIDINNRKKAEEDLIREKEFSEIIIQTSSAIIVGLDKNHIIKIFNRGAETITGYKKEEVIGKDWFKLFIKTENIEELNQTWGEAWGIDSHSYENSILTKSGDEKIISWQNTGIYEGDDSSKHLLISIGEDITESKLDGELILETKAKLNEAQRIAKIGSWELDLISNMLSWSDEVYRIFDIDNHEFEVTYEAFLENIHPEDRDFVNNAYSESVKNKIPYNIIHRLLLKDGTIKFVNEVCETTYDDSGNAILSMGTIQDITERKMAEDALKESQIFTKTLLDASPDLIYIYDIVDGKNIYSNEGINSILGYSAKVVKSMGEKFLPDLMHPDDFKNYLTNILPIYETVKDGEFVEHEYRMKHKNGDWCWLNSRETIFKRQNNGEPKQIFGIISDITIEKNSKAELEHSHDLMRYIIEHNKSDVAVHNNDLNYIYVSKSYLEHFKVKEKDVIGKHHYDVFPDLPQKWRDVHSRVLKGEVLSADDDPYVREDGRIDWTRWECRPWYKTDGQIGGIIVYTEVITEQKRVEKELERHRDNLEEIVKERTDKLEESQNTLINLVDDLNNKSSELEKSNARYAEINEELENFTYSVSHDLKAPLRGIDGYSQLLLETYTEELNQEAIEFLVNIRNSTKQMNGLIEDLLAYSRMERKDCLFEKVNIKDLVNNILKLYNNNIEINNVKVKVVINNSFLPLTDKDGMELVLRNLIDNAFKFSSGKKNSRVEIGASENDKHWLIYVKDNGIGFDMKYHDRIYKIFHRLHLPEEYDGTGIGLAIVNKMTNRMNGKIWAESSVGKGACFYLEIMK